MFVWLGAQSEFPHEPGHPLLSAPLAFGSQHGVDAWTAIDLPIGVVDAFDALPQPRVLLAAAAGRALEPGILPTHRHPQHAAHRVDRVLLPVLGNELVLHRDSRE